MSEHRLPSGGRIQREQPLSMSFNGQPLPGFAGDTLASALLARGERVLGRSFKYHRPRGIMAAGVEEPNALLTVGQGATQEPNLQATMLELHPSLEARTQNAWPSVRFDLMALNSLFAPLLSAGFYYKTFMGPTRRAWMFYEHFIRRAAGLGAASVEPDPSRYDWQHDFVDVLVVGSGPAGLSAALAAQRSGAQVMVVEQDFELGGALLSRPVDGAHSAWLADMLGELTASTKTRLHSRSTAFGLYDGNVVGVLERSAPGLADVAYGVPRQRLRVVRAGAIVLACGAIERPLVFAGNDRPGVMLASSVTSYLNRYAVLAGRRAVYATNNDASYEDAIALASAGAQVILTDARAEPRSQLLAQAKTAGVDVRLATTVAQTRAWQSVRSCQLVPFDLASGCVTGHGQWQDVDLVAMSGGWTPSVHLSSHRGVKPVYRSEIGAFVPGEMDRLQFSAGAMNGMLGLSEAIHDGWAKGLAASAALGMSGSAHAGPLQGGCPAWPEQDEGASGFSGMPAAGPRFVRVSGKAFVDFQNDVTVEDVGLAHREGYQSVEHLKRYTTLGMGTEQGKTSNLNGLAQMADRRGVEIPEVGTTTFRPPYTPVTIGALAGRGHGSHLQPVRRTAMHDWHVSNGGQMMEAGLWKRPLWYSRHGADLASAYKAEMDHVREQVGVADVSTLGKIDVQGPDAAEFLNRVYVNGYAKLEVGKARYGFMLREDGIVLDDGTTSRVGEFEYFMTTTTAQAARVMSHLEFLLQVVWPELRVTVASVSDQWAAMSVAGPRSRELLQAAFPEIDFGNQAIPHMGLCDVTLGGELSGLTVRIIRLTFSGELAYEIYCGTHHARRVWDHLFAVGKAWNLQPYGLEALGSLRIEKGHVVGSEMDGRTTLDDMGQGRMASKIKPFWGDALRRRESLVDPDRPSLVGLEALDEAEPPSNGAILFFVGDEIRGHGRGHITSTTYSKSLGRSIGLGLLQGGVQQVGQEVVAASPVQGRQYRLRVVSPHFLDPEGERYRG